MEELQDLLEYALHNTGLPGTLRVHIETTIKNYKEVLDDSI